MNNIDSKRVKETLIASLVNIYVKSNCRKYLIYLHNRKSNESLQQGGPEYCMKSWYPNSQNENKKICPKMRKEIR